MYKIEILKNINIKYLFPHSRLNIAWTITNLVKKSVLAKL